MTKILLEGDIRKWHIQNLPMILECKDDYRLASGEVESHGCWLSGFSMDLSYDEYTETLIITCGRNW